MIGAPLLSIWQILARITGVIVVAEFAIMQMFAYLSIAADGLSATLLDVFLLAAISAPAIYFLVARPFVSSYNHALGEVTRLAATDQLTQLANRREFDQAVVMEHARHARSGGELSLIMLDVDHFKAFNDLYGHQRGDECLRQLAQVVAANVNRPADLAARYGGEEFVCILPETDGEGAFTIAEKIRAQIRALQIPHSDSPDGYVTASLGLGTVYCCSENSASTLIAEADRLLYLAKSRGRNRVEIADRHEFATHVPTFVKLIWKPNYCSGHPLIDRQHEQLFHTANRLIDASLAEGGREFALAEAVRLLAEARQHFDDEIGILEAIGYSATAQHAAEHEALLSQAQSLVAGFRDGKLSVGDLFAFLATDLIAKHMLGSDIGYFSMTSAHSVHGR